MAQRNPFYRLYRPLTSKYLTAMDRTVASSIRRELAQVDDSQREALELDLAEARAQVDGYRAELEVAKAERDALIKEAELADAGRPVSAEASQMDTTSVDIQSEIEAVWEGHDDEYYRRDMSHWRGEGRWDEDEWLSIGRESLGHIQALAAAVGRDLADTPPVVLEWGPGGGSNLYAFAPLARRLYAVDLSSKNLEESGRVVAELDSAPLTPIVLGDVPSSVGPSFEDPVDIFISTAVFQHFPTKAYGKQVLETVRSLMADDGLGFVQIRFDDGNPRFRPKSVTTYAETHITATSYDIAEFWDLLRETGFRPFSVCAIASRSNYAGFLFEAG